MEFSLGGSNPLENYISHNPIPPITSDSIRSLHDLEAIDLYFHAKKTSISSSVEQLWRRIAQCEGRCMQLSSSVDLSYSRINGESGNPQRDLLPVSFKEVEWTQSSRVHVQEDEERAKIIEKYEREVEHYQKRLEITRQEQAKLLGDIENAFLDELTDCQSLMEGKQRGYEAGMNKLEMRMSEMGRELELQVEGVGGQLEGTYALLSRMIGARLDDIQQEMADLGV